MLNLNVDKLDDVLIVSANGRLDQLGAPSIEKACIGLIQEGSRRVLMDMAGVDYISSAGLRSLLVTAKMMKGVQGRIVLCNLTAMVKEVMEIAGFDKVLVWADNREAGLAALY